MYDSIWTCTGSNHDKPLECGGPDDHNANGCVHHLMKWPFACTDEDHVFASWRVLHDRISTDMLWATPATTRQPASRRLKTMKQLMAFGKSNKLTSLSTYWYIHLLVCGTLSSCLWLQSRDRSRSHSAWQGWVRNDRFDVYYMLWNGKQIQFAIKELRSGWI